MASVSELTNRVKRRSPEVLRLAGAGDGDRPRHPAWEDPFEKGLNTDDLQQVKMRPNRGVLEGKSATTGATTEIHARREYRSWQDNK
jgi:hypothetical protein